MSLALSVVIPTFNESQNIASCIQSVQDLAQEILVMDNFSQDGTPEIARLLNARVHQRAFDNFSANKNAAIELALNDWVLILDADERLTPALRNEIQNTLNSPAGADAFRIKRDAYFCGKKVRCWSGKSVIRLFDKRKAAYDSAKLVHEELVVRNGTIDSLLHPMEHYTFRSFEQYLPKVHSFTSLAAREAYEKGKRVSWFSLFLYPPLRLLKTYFVKAGILDGIPGLIIAWLSAYTVYLKMAKLWELQNSQ
ncbi:glycosyltransferase family 2 protein [bacterium]|nr:glycosyltransferase family 2 protein [bacterium]